MRDKLFILGEKLTLARPVSGESAPCSLEKLRALTKW